MFQHLRPQLIPPRGAVGDWERTTATMRDWSGSQVARVVADLISSVVHTYIHACWPNTLEHGRRVHMCGEEGDAPESTLHSENPHSLSMCVPAIREQECRNRRCRSSQEKKSVKGCLKGRPGCVTAAMESVTISQSRCGMRHAAGYVHIPKLDITNTPNTFTTCVKSHQHTYALTWSSSACSSLPRAILSVSSGMENVTRSHPGV